MPEEVIRASVAADRAFENYWATLTTFMGLQGTEDDKMAHHATFIAGWTEGASWRAEA